jgi:hypothetical protein
MKKYILISILFCSGCMQSIVNREVDKRLSDYKRKALSCLETEGTTQRIVNTFFKNEPPKAHWRDLKYSNDHKNRISAQSREFSSNDKIQHCYVGHVLAKQRNFKTGVFAGFFKEAMDVGDCRRATHFEISDKLATIIGARIAKRGENISGCLDVNRKLQNQMQNYLLRKYASDQDYIAAMIRVCEDQNQRRRRPDIVRHCKSLGL